MPTQCTTKPLEFEGHRRRRVVAAFDGGPITSDAGALLLRRVEQRLSLFDQMADCFTDLRDPSRIQHSLRTLIAQRIVAIALGYEDLNDHDQTSSRTAICSPPCCDRPTSMPPPEPSSRSSASSPTCAANGLMSRSCCGPTPASPERS